MVAHLTQDKQTYCSIITCIGIITSFITTIIIITKGGAARAMQRGPDRPSRQSHIQEGTGSVRFVSVPDSFRTFIGLVRFGSLRKFTFPGSTRFALRFRTRHGSVRFGSVGFRVRFWPVPELNSSVLFGSVRPLIPS